MIAATGLRGTGSRSTRPAPTWREPAAPYRLLGAVEAAVPVLLGAVLGVALGFGVGAVVAAQADLPAAARRGPACAPRCPGVAVSAVPAAVVVAVTSSWAGGSERTAWRVVDATIVVGLAVVALAVARGTIGTASLDAGTDPC